MGFGPHTLPPTVRSTIMGLEFLERQISLHTCTCSLVVDVSSRRSRRCVLGTLRTVPVPPLGTPRPNFTPPRSPFVRSSRLPVNSCGSFLLTPSTPYVPSFTWALSLLVYSFLRLLILLDPSRSSSHHNLRFPVLPSTISGLQFLSF